MKCPQCLETHSGDCLACAWRRVDALQAEVKKLMHDFDMLTLGVSAVEQQRDAAQAEVARLKDVTSGLEQSIRERTEEVVRLREALEKYGLPCAVWYCHGPYGPSPDQESPQKIRAALEHMPVPSKSEEGQT